MKKKITRIYSENSTFQIINSLKTNRKKRNKLGLFFVEGVRNINNIVKYGWEFDSLIFSPDQPLSNWAVKIIEESQSINHYHVSKKIMNKISSKTKPSELMALIKIEENNFGSIPIDDTPLVVVSDRPQSPGNLGSLIRSCDALGVNGLIVTGHAVDLYDPQVISASTGSFFAIPIVRKESHNQLVPWITALKKRLGAIQIIGTDESAKYKINDFDFRKPTILLAGNEKWGLSDSYKKLSDNMVKIPMQGSASSLNVTVATSIILYEINKQRG